MPKCISTTLSSAQHPADQAAELSADQAAAVLQLSRTRGFASFSLLRASSWFPLGQLLHSQKLQSFLPPKNSLLWSPCSWATQPTCSCLSTATPSAGFTPHSSPHTDTTAASKMRFSSPFSMLFCLRFSACRPCWHSLFSLLSFQSSLPC